MRHFTTAIFAFLVLFSTEILSSTLPEGRHDNPSGHKRRDHCLTTHEAEELRDLWISFFVEINDGGTEVRNSVTDDFKYLSEGFNSATPGWSLPLDAPSFDGKEAFVKFLIAFTSGPTKSNFTVLAWDHGCDTFTFRWYWEYVPGALPIAGNGFMFVQKGSYLFEKIYSEFNTVLYLSEIGCKPMDGCGSGGAPKM